MNDPDRPSILGHIADTRARGTWLAASAMWESAARLRLDRSCWSIAELRLSERDIQWLEEWAASLQPIDLEISPGPDLKAQLPMGARDEAGFGLLAIALFAEKGRREGKEGEIWNVAQFEPDGAARFGAGVQHALFQQSSGQPTSFLKGAIKAATSVFGLRSIDAEGDSQTYYQTLFLQFGFTEQSIESKLHEWLADRSPGTQAVQRLRQGAQSSQAFQRLWGALLSLRRSHEISEEQRDLLRSSPWVVPEWTDQLEAAARRKVRTTTTSRSGRDRVVEAETKRLVEGVLEKVCLRWPVDDEPFFEGTFIASDLPEGDVRILSNEQEVLALHASGGETEVLSGQRRISLGARPSVTLRAKAIDGEPLSEIAIQLWDPTEPVLAFRARSGRSLDPWGAKFGHRDATWLLVPEVLSIEGPSPNRWQRMDPWHTLYEFDTSRVRRLRLMLEDQLVWDGGSDTGGTSEPDWVAGVSLTHVDKERVRTDGVFNIQIRVPDGVEVAAAGVFGDAEHVFDANPGGGHLLTEWPRERATNSLRVQLTLRRGSQLMRVSRSVPVKVIGSMMQVRDRGWAPLPEDAEITRARVAQERFRVFQGQTKDALLLFEGRRPLRKLWSGAQPIGPTIACGSPLQVSHENGRPLFKLCGSVVDHGLLENVWLDGNRLQLKLNHVIEFGPEHELVTWRLDEGPRRTPLRTEAEPTDEGRAFEVPLSSEHPLAVAIAFRGERQGSWWFGHQADQLATAEPTEELAAMVRWFRLPILHHAWRQRVWNLVQRSPVRMIVGLTLDTGRYLPEGFQPADDKEWSQAVRELLRPPHEPCVDLTHEDVETLVDALGCDDPEGYYLVGAARRLADLDPRIFERLVVSYLLHHFLLKEGRTGNRIEGAFAQLRMVVEDIEGRIDARRVPDHLDFLDRVTHDVVPESVSLEPQLGIPLRRPPLAHAISRLRGSSPLRIWMGATEGARRRARELWPMFAVIVLLKRERALARELGTPLGELRRWARQYLAGLWVLAEELRTEATSGEIRERLREQVLEPVLDTDPDAGTGRRFRRMLIDVFLQVSGLTEEEIQQRFASRNLAWCKKAIEQERRGKGSFLAAAETQTRLDFDTSALIDEYTQHQGWLVLALG